MAQVTEQSKQYVKTLQNQLKVDPQQVYKLINELKQSLEANRINRNGPKTRFKAR